MRGALPLAFALAMTAEVAHETLADLHNPTTPLRVGILSSLTDAMFAADKNLPGEPAATTRERLAQFYPNRNCFSNNFQNCK